MSNKQFASHLIAWYKTNHRTLPWRQTGNPYHIWISEIILQQTRVAQGLPYYHKFIAQFPTIKDLAAATEQQILLVWQGLGYYSRARNMHKCATTIVSTYGGAFPTEYRELLKLPGIGPYTAAAIASLAFNRPVPVVDGNVYRVLARVFGIYLNIAEGKSFNAFFELSSELLPPQQPALYNQAVMELGALVCTPQKPDCSGCPIAGICEARATNKQAMLPIKKKVLRTRNRYFNYLVIHYNNKIGVVKRTKKDIWQGLYEFYNIETPKGTTIDELTDVFLEELLKLNPKIEHNTKLPKHKLSHQTIFAQVWHCYFNKNQQVEPLLVKYGVVLCSNTELVKLPKPVLITNFLNNVS